MYTNHKETVVEVERQVKGEFAQLQFIVCGFVQVLRGGGELGSTRMGLAQAFDDPATATWDDLADNFFVPNQS
jgi:hypothetical protein